MNSLGTSKSSSLEASIRVFADVLLIQGSLLFGFLARFLHYAYTSENWGGPPPAVFHYYASNYVANAPLLTLLCLGVFATSGFYTYGRAYQGRYKLLITTQAVCVSYLLYGMLSFAALSHGWSGALTFGVWIIAAITNGVVVAGARIWSNLWARWVHKRPAHIPNSSQSILVIGGAGYIGSALIPVLLAQGYKVKVLDLMLYGPAPLGPYLENPQLEMIEADFRNVDSVVRACRGVGAVVHLGGLVGDPACAVDEELTVDINLMATRMVAEVAKGSGVSRFIFASTCSVYGASDELLDEHSALNPVSLYARSKIASEQVILGLADVDFAPTCLRFSTIYGISGRTRFDLVVNLLTAKAALEEQITLQGGDQWRPFLHVEDAALSVVKVLGARADLIRDQIFNVGCDDHNYTLQQIADMIQRQVPQASIIEQGQISDRRNYRVRFSKIRKRLGFQVKWTPELGIAQVLREIREGRVTNYQDPLYSNVKFLLEDGNVRLSRPDTDWAQELIKKSGEVRV